MEKRQYHLSFCRVCTNRKLTFKQGIVCGLTDKIADFDKLCPAYIYDKNEFQKFIRTFENEIISNYATTNLEGHIKGQKFEKKDYFQSRKYISLEKTHGLEFRKDKSNDIALVILILLFIIILLFGNYINHFSWDFKSFNVIAIILLLPVSIYLIYKFLFHNYKPIIIINKNGIDQNGKTIFWNDIYDYGVLKNTGKSKSEIIFIGTISSGIKKINITGLDVNADDFIEIIKLNTKNVLQLRSTI